ncbi:hypothetical protein [Bathymodiolus japonicus methanotrophic gill symbiont]|nr:hypothetical protein [Bathymodiolus japonicus methanotrophic gill symbiont]
MARLESANCPVAYQGLKITTSLSSVSMIFSVCVKLALSLTQTSLFSRLN